MIQHGSKIWIAGAMALGVLSLGGCATKKYVDEQNLAQNAEVGGRIDTVSTRVDHVEGHVATVEGTAKDALDRATAAGKLAEGKFLYNVTLQDDGYKFKTNKYALSDDEKTKLTDFASKLKSDNRNVYIEIQGHTDSTGTADYNETLGEERADAVRLFLNEQGVALNRMNTISYGKTAPVADNKTKAGRAQNRRVNIVVMA